MSSTLAGLNLDEIQLRIDAGYIRRQWTDDRALMILNYTRKAEYDRVWDEYTRLCRGLILNADGSIHSRSFPKFFNLGEMPETMPENLPKEDPIITVKEDGYLGLTYWHKGQVKVASRGSFESEYALWATKWLRENLPPFMVMEMDSHGPGEGTLVFEILYPHRRIVVDNTWRAGMVLTAAFTNATGEEIPYSDLQKFHEASGIDIVARFESASLDEALFIANETKGTALEGFVAYYPKANLRVKLKGEDYRKIHRIATRLTKRRIWEMIKPIDDPEWGWVPNGAALEDIQSILPEEHAAWIWRVEAELEEEFFARFARIERCATGVWSPNYGAKPEGAQRKDVVLKLQNRCPDDWHLAMSLVDGNEKFVVEEIWKRMRPLHEVPILRDGDDE